MKIKKIGTRMLASILPVVILAMVVLTVVSVTSSRNISEKQIKDHMSAELEAQISHIEGDLDSVSNLAETISAVMETSYQDMSMDDFEEMLAAIIPNNNLVLGSGLWFEPYVFDSTQEYIGPYVYKDGGQIATTWDYSNAEYNYFEQEYYTMCKGASGAQFTDPYYDPTSDTVMSSCAAPITVGGKFMGCVTVDIELGTIIEVVDAIQVGVNGKGMLLSGSGTYLAGTESEKIQNGTSIRDDENASLARAGEDILANTEGVTFFHGDEGRMNLYYATLPETGWKLVISMPQSELNQDINALQIKMLAVTAAAVVLAIVIILVLVRSISRSIGKVQDFAESLAGGNFTIEPIRVRSQDELGVMGDALNQMYDSNKDVLTNIKVHAVEIDESSSTLQDAAIQLAERFAEIQRFMNEVNSAMLNTSAATEQVNASTEEVLSNVNLLAAETEQNKEMAAEIRARAQEVEQACQTAYESATSLSGSFEQRLMVSIENAQVVDNISQLAAAISEIAEQINLLSLNASIEAARAGEAGRGFAVVATEIGALAANTAETVDKIQSTIGDVQRAFNDLVDEAKGMLGFVQNTVAPDYSKFVGVGEQYGKDAEAIDQSSTQFSVMAEAIRSIMQEVTDAIQSIAEATQETTDLSSNIMESVDQVSDNVQDISDMSESQASIAGNLNEVVGKFILE